MTISKTNLLDLPWRLPPSVDRLCPELSCRLRCCLRACRSASLLFGRLDCFVGSTFFGRSDASITSSYDGAFLRYSRFSTLNKKTVRIPCFFRIFLVDVRLQVFQVGLLSFWISAIWMFWRIFLRAGSLQFCYTCADYAHEHKWYHDQRENYCSWSVNDWLLIV